MQLGLATSAFGRIPAEESAQLAAAAGLDGVQIGLDSEGIECGSVNDLDSLTPEACAHVRSAYESRGLRVHALDAHVDLGNDDDDGRGRQADYFRGAMPVARSLGTNVLVTGAGPRGVGAYERAVDTMRSIMPVAHERDVIVALRPSYADSVCCSEKARAFIEEVGYNRLKVLIDPADMLIYDSLERIFSLLGEFILLACASDVIVDQGGGLTFAPAGQGQMDYRRYVELLMSHEVDVLIVERVTPDTLDPTLDFLRGVIADVQGGAR